MIHKSPGDVCTVTIDSIAYKGPARRVWFVGMVRADIGGEVLVLYQSPVMLVDLQESASLVAISLGLSLAMAPSNSLAYSYEGIGNATVRILDSSDPNTATVLMHKGWVDTYIFVSVLASKVYGVGAEFRHI